MGRYSGDMSDPDPDPAARPDEAEIGRWVERFASSLIGTGVPPMPARVMARMLVSDGGTMTASELASSLKVSQPAISGAVRFLLLINFLRKERVPGSRKDHYRIPEDAWYAVISQRNRALGEWVANADRGVELFGGDDNEIGDRLARVGEFFRFIQDDMDQMMSRWRERTGSGRD